MDTVAATRLAAEARARGELLLAALIEKALTGELTYETYCVLPTPTFTAVDKLTQQEAMQRLDASGI